MSRLFVAILVGLFVCQIGLICTTVYLHRTVTHKALTMTPRLRLVFRTLIWITTGIRPRQWAAVHRRHHAFTDVEGDPHSPVLLGFWKVQIANAALYRKAARDGVTVQRYAKDLPPDRLDKLFFDHALLGLSIGVLILWGCLGWEYGLIAAGVHTVSYLALNGAINAIGHSFGGQPYENTARNNQWLAFITGGEGLHNNHHAAPTSAHLAHRAGELDPGWWLITFFRWRHWAHVRLEEPRFIARSVPSSS